MKREVQSVIINVLRPHFHATNSQTQRSCIKQDKHQVHILQSQYIEDKCTKETNTRKATWLLFGIDPRDR